MQKLSKDEIEQIEAVQGHIESMHHASWYNASAGKLSSISGNLRFLLSEGHLATAWRSSGLGGPMTFQTWKIDSIDTPDAIAICGGADVIPGVPFSVSGNAKLKQVSVDLKTFCNMTRIQCGSVKASTNEVVKFFANTMGGSHLDPQGKSPKSRKATYDMLRDLRDGKSGLFISAVNDKSIVHHELLSIAQAVLRSPEVGRLIRLEPRRFEIGQPTATEV